MEIPRLPSQARARVDFLGQKRVPVTSAQMGAAWHTVAFGHPKDSSSSVAGRRWSQIRLRLRRLLAASSIMWLSTEYPSTDVAADRGDFEVTPRHVPAEAVAGPSSSQARWQ